MSQQGFDVIVIGARCAGSPAAMLLARAGHRVLLVDKATFPSDTMSTHMVHPPGVAALIAHGYCPRRTVLDKLLVDAAVEAGGGDAARTGVLRAREHRANREPGGAVAGFVDNTGVNACSNT